MFRDRDATLLEWGAHYLLTYLPIFLRLGSHPVGLNLYLELLTGFELMILSALCPGRWGYRHVPSCRTGIFISFSEKPVNSTRVLMS